MSSHVPATNASQRAIDGQNLEVNTVSLFPEQS